MKTKEEQIEEMAKTLCEDYGKCKECALSNPKCENPCMIKEDCERLHNVGYRKQSKGAWIIKGNYFQRLVCTNCGGFGVTMSRFCPNCGAKMKGDE